MISSDQNNNNDDDNNNNNRNNTLLSPFPPAFFWMERLLHNSALSVFVFVCFFFKKRKYVEYSLVEITVWVQTQNIQDPQTALRNAGIFHGYLSSEEKGEEESEFKNLQFTLKTSLSSSSSHLERVKKALWCCIRKYLSSPLSPFRMLTCRTLNPPHRINLFDHMKKSRVHKSHYDPKSHRKLVSTRHL